MHLKHLKIQNFRALENIEVEFDKRVNVIVGPNAVGKTTVIEAIRLVRAILAPRTQNEATQALFSLGAASPHFPNRLQIAAIARDITLPIIISCRYKLTNQEFDDLKANNDQIAYSIVQSRMGQSFANQGVLIGYLSSAEGQLQLNNVKTEIDQALQSISTSKQCHLELTISQSSGLGSNSNPIESGFVAFLEQRLPPNKTTFTYFPADRALPSGEQPLQLGAADASQQLESYNSQPQLKYTRLKNLIFSAAITQEIGNNARPISDEFGKIFQGILKGRNLSHVGINEIGLLTVQIEDTENGRVFDLDGMSSGEKGLILTFLLIERSVADDGIILLDEPELHLNPAVCKDLLSYLVDEYVKRKNLQIIVCSHSPEILAGAFDNDECNLYHLVSGSNLSKVRIQDQIPVIDALRRLGSTESDDLLYRAVIFVEGIDDISLLETGFSILLKRYKLKESRGRKEVEKVITSIQSEEKKGINATTRYFIFDRDETPTNLSSSATVKVLQWDRRCLENYLIDIDSIANLLMSNEVLKTPLKNHGEVCQLLKDTAFKQLDEIAAKAVYQRYDYQSTGLRKEDIKGKPVSDISQSLFSRLEKAKNQFASLTESEWKRQFETDVQSERKQLELKWQTDWINECDGKRLLEDLTRSVTLTMDIRRFKTRIMKEIMLNQAESWKAIEVQLQKLLN